MNPLAYPVAERFKAPQGEGSFTGAQMAFVRLVGCSVGQKVCTACDTDFEKVYQELGGGHYTAEQIAAWAQPCPRICLTGGEPLDRDVRAILLAAGALCTYVNIETSGTRHPDWLDPGSYKNDQGKHAVGYARNGDADRLSWSWTKLWLAVSPKPGYLQTMIDAADEIKVILGGLGDGPGWPTLEDAVRWADSGRLVYLQPRNLRMLIDTLAMDEALKCVAKYPQLRLSAQLHKYLRTR